MTHPRVPDEPFRFLDLPKELRYMVYENLPRIINNTTIEPLHNKAAQRPAPSFTLIHRSTSTSILRVCKEIYEEVAPLVHKTIRNFILEASPKVAGSTDPNLDGSLLRPIMRAAAREFGHLRVRFGSSQDGSDAAPANLIDYSSGTSVFLRHLAEARKTTAEWDTFDLPMLPWRGPPSRNSIFLPGSSKAHTHYFPHSAASGATRRTRSTFITTASIQLLYNYMKRLTRPTLSNPTIDFVNCWDRESMKHDSDTFLNWEHCLTGFVMAFGIMTDLRSVCYDFGVDIKFEGYVPINQEQRPLLSENALVVLPHAACPYENGHRPITPPQGVGQLVFWQKPITEEEWREGWLPNE